MEAVIEWLMRTGKWVTGLIAGFWGIILPLHGLITCCIIAICVDFITGNVANYHRNKRAGRKYAFESEKMWKTVWKLGLSIVGIGFAWMLDSQVIEPAFTSLKLAHIFTAFIIGTEFWSFLENAAVISDHPVFRALRKVMREEIKSKTKLDINEDE